MNARTRISELLDQLPEPTRSRALAVAAELRLRGATRVAIRSEDLAHLTSTLLGALTGGATVLPIDRRLHPEELARLLRHADVELLFDDAPDPRLSPPCPLIGPTAAPPPRTPLTPRPGALLLYTSGSTAQPKGALLDETALITNAEAWNRRYRTAPDDVVLSTLSLSHSFGLTIGVLATLLAGAQLHACAPAALASRARTLRPTLVLAVAPIYARLARARPDRDDFASVRALLSGAAPLARTTVEALQERLQTPLLQTYGLTEAGPVVTGNPPDDNRPGTVGPPLDGVDLHLEPDGELLVRGPSLMRGYLGDRAASERAIAPGGWLRTGDLAAIEEGYVRLLGRKKDLIIRGGEKIYPQEIEEVLLLHPAVLDAAVIGVPLRLRSQGLAAESDETPAAWVVLAPNASLERLDLESHCARHLAGFKVPRRFRALHRLPRNANGKLVRVELLERWSDEDA